MLNYAAIAVVGLLLGVLGGGGSTLILPVLVYLVGLPAVQATSASLLIVGVAAVFGAVGYFRKGLVDLPAVVMFGGPSVAGVFVARLVFMPRIPPVLYSAEGFELTRRGFLLATFSVLVLISAFCMIRRDRRAPSERAAPPAAQRTAWKSVAAGLFVGMSTGLVGAGGGFMIVPALIIFLKMETRQAIATSLFVIAMKSLLGFAADAFIVSDLNWPQLTGFTLAAVVGILTGVRLNAVVDADRLKVAFGWLVLVIGISILVKEFY
ncbi:MAG: sulfite exporter TauE/SafE family protein [Planctomycetaceae bacterium]|nr:sulfite exporter TauE/SafE family protein [Planctomycetaceae bacterium]